jgi:heavy metal translocating P-type ATPase
VPTSSTAAITTSGRQVTERPGRSRTGPFPVRRTPLFALTEMRWAAAAVVLFLIGLGLQLSDSPMWSWWTAYLACYVAGGWEPGLAGVQALRDRTLDVDLLMVIAAIGAAAIGQVTDGALLIVIFAGSGALEALATARTEDSVRGLLDLAPVTATLLDSDGERTVTAVDLAPGDVIVVRPGEQVAADGRVVAGASEIDQASITGEPLPVTKAVGDEVFAGTLNGTGSVRVQVTRRAEDSVVARIATLVEQASRTKAKTQLFVEKIEQRYSLGMVAATLAVFAIPLLAGQTLSEALLRAMTFMIVASPCAVVLATMPPLLAAIANAGRHGVLVKSAVVMERLGTNTQVAFDKTGTLTRARPELATIALVPDNPLTEDEVLGLAAAVEHSSEHPLAGAIVSAARRRGVHVAPVQSFSATPGRGVTGRVGGHTLEVGSPAVLAREPDDPTGTAPVAAARARVDAVTRQGHTAVVVSRDGLPIGVLGITDQIRADAAATVADLTRLTGSTPVLLTGDNAATGHQLAAAVGITDVHAELLPEDKVTAVRALASTGARVMVVGDGVNDAPALAAANTGIAMGIAGADLAVASADAVIARDELAAIPAVIALSRRARTVVTANLVIAGVFIVGLVLWDLLGHLPLPLGVAGHEGSTIIVGLNGLRLLRHSAWRRAAGNSVPSAETDVSAL